jgi:hypothetical protein
MQETAHHMDQVLLESHKQAINTLLLVLGAHHERRMAKLIEIQESFQQLSRIHLIAILGMAPKGLLRSHHCQKTHDPIHYGTAGQ